VTLLQDNVAAPYANPFAPWLAQNVVGLVIDVQKAGGAECARKSRKQKENEKGTRKKRRDIHIYNNVR
tara:strand:- start:410 stop:613 length:204 start_codon:yes stop_codon:yes gene_type:complete